ncbi:hepatitis A virus cellular receptor 1-like [Scophthalmus maximus]|uniref:hepatitis A virus cellular receptor 1-like n=1 Tax=Scophthalmus maximus TaxID=52904 RepID=UPI001FA922D2|nr:hepatitis A virus cellular receptor 1-like [Scophthalmus maximus]XP_035480468.2 hepatitis A virus cellular receptor 1-like [Scophthalmus maximus]
MPLPLLRTITCVLVLSVLACVLAITMETVVGVAGRRVKLPCRSEAVKQDGVEVCWGRGEPSLFTCHNTLINTAGGQTSYRRSHRYSVSSSSSLSILPSRPSDSGLYHCRVQLSGLFNDQTSTVHLIVISPPSVVPDNEDLNAPRTATSQKGSTTTEERGSDVTNTTEPMVALVQSPVEQQQVNRLQTFIGNTLRLSFIIFIPTLLLTAAYRVWRLNRRPESDGRLSQSEEEEGYTSV